MKPRILRPLLGTIAAGSLLLTTGCAANEIGLGDGLEGTLNGAGSSAMGSAQEAWIAAFQTDNGGITINYDPTGSGAGREAFFGGAVHFAGSDSYLKDEELELEPPQCAAGTGMYEVPVYVSPIAIIHNVAGVSELRLAPATIAGIFKGTITRWDDPKIKADNPDAPLPAASITAVHRSDDSGTTKNFSDYLSKTAPEVWDGEVGDAFPYQSGEGAKGTSGVVDAVKNGVNTIGYADASKAQGLGIAQLRVGEDWVSYSAEAAAAVVEVSPLLEGRPETDMAVVIDRTTTAAGAYPLVLVSYLIGCLDYQDDDLAELVREYALFLLSERGQRVAAEGAGSAPLTAAVRDQAATIVAKVN